MVEVDANDLSENTRRWRDLRFRFHLENIKKAFIFLRSKQIEPILIKGWAAGRFYPVPAHRYSTDVDLAVSPSLFQETSMLLDGDSERAWGVDLHCGFRHLDTLDWNDLHANSQLIDLEGVDVRVLRPEDHLRVIIVHWLNDGGAHRKKLEDVVHILNANRAHFDWERCLDTVSGIRRTWILKTIGVAARYAGLNLESMPFRDEIEDIPKWFITALEKEWNSGTSLRPLHTVLGNRKELWSQIRKRIPPNAIQASIEVEAPFDDRSRVRYQIQNILRRLSPSLLRIGQTLPDRGRSNNG